MTSKPPTRRATDTEWWGVAEAASHCRIAVSTWRDHVSNGTAPAPDTVTLTDRHWRPFWRPATVREWNTNQRRKPGRPRKPPTEGSDN